MSTPSLHLGGKLLHHLLPFHGVWTNDGELAWLSPALRQYWRLDRDSPAESTEVQLQRPFESPLEIQLFDELTGMMVHVRYGDASDRVLRSEIIDMGDDGWLLVGVPPLSRVRDLEALGLHLSDLPMHMGTSELLIANEAAEVSKENSEQAAKQLTQRKTELKRSLHEKEILLKEIHHRVKNNLQIISSLLTMQSRTVTDPAQQAAFSESVQRVRSIAMIHELLYGMDSLVDVDLGTYTQKLAAALRLTLAPLARIDVIVDSVQVPVELALPLGLILNELLTNAFKYGLPPASESPIPEPSKQTRDPDVMVELTCRDDELRIVVADRGPGLSQNEIAQAETLGLTLVRALVRQLRGELKVSSDNGARFELTCSLTDGPKSQRAPRSARQPDAHSPPPPSSSHAPDDAR